MGDGVTAAIIGATASAIGFVLTYLVSIHSVRRSVSTSNGAPLGPLLEARLDRLEGRLDRMERSLADVREWLASAKAENACRSGRSAACLDLRRIAPPPGPTGRL
jgi:hypothetical protein